MSNVKNNLGDLAVDDLMRSYSSIIGPEDYNELMTNQHLYIDVSDRFINKKISEICANGKKNVIELGCGPGRVSQLIANLNGIEYIGVDIDPVFINYASSIITSKNAKFIVADIETVSFEQPVDIFFSQGFHHHIRKGENTDKYLVNIYKQLVPGGVYILSDEFIPDYSDNGDRNIRLVIWYSHVIANAHKNGYHFLAYEEAKTLLDDIYEGEEDSGIKSKEQLQLVLESSTAIDTEARADNILKARELAQDFLFKLEQISNVKLNGDITLDLSRHDYKISDRVLREEVTKAGFIVEDVRSFGPIDNIGGMTVYLLRK